MDNTSSDYKFKQRATQVFYIHMKLQLSKEAQEHSSQIQYSDVNDNYETARKNTP
jgi:hypothetical protein